MLSVFAGSCDKIRCPAGKHCLVDQNLKPHCVRCSRRCPAPVPGKHVCGADGATYPSACHLREAACRKGKAIPFAYKGRCKRKPLPSHQIAEWYFPLFLFYYTRFSLLLSLSLIARSLSIYHQFTFSNSSIFSLWYLFLLPYVFSDYFKFLTMKFIIHNNVFSLLPIFKSLRF